MTLVMVAGVGSAFTVMTSDERIAYVYGDDHVEAIEGEKVLKNHPLTDSVLFGWGANYDLAMEIKDQLDKVVGPGDTLDICKLLLKDITDNMDLERNVAIILSGFYSDGSSGMILKRTGAPIQELKMKELEYRYAILPPTGDYSDRQKELLHIEDFTPGAILEEFPKLGYGEWLQKSMTVAVNHLIQLHGIISYQEPVATTPEGFYYLRYKDTEGIIRTVSGEYDTTSIHDQLRIEEKEQQVV